MWCSTLAALDDVASRALGMLREGKIPMFFFFVSGQDHKRLVAAEHLESTLITS